MEKFQSIEDEIKKRVAQKVKKDYRTFINLLNGNKFSKYLRVKNRDTFTPVVSDDDNSLFPINPENQIKKHRNYLILMKQ